MHHSVHARGRRPRAKSAFEPPSHRGPGARSVQPRLVLASHAGAGNWAGRSAVLRQIADQIALWWNQGAADGFNVMGPVLPASLEAFVEHVVPILQKRGLFRTEYQGKTLREHYGLARPESQYRRSACGAA